MFVISDIYISMKIFICMSGYDNENIITFTCMNVNNQMNGMNGIYLLLVEYFYELSPNYIQCTSNCNKFIVLTNKLFWKNMFFLIICF